MWQRIQTVYLAVAAVIAVIFIFIPVAHFENDIFIPGHDPLSTVLSIGIAVLALITIGLYRNRKLQRMICFLNGVLAVALFVWMCYAATQNDEYIEFKPGAGVPVVIMLLLILAARAIKKDAKLVSSMDRMR